LGNHRFAVIGRGGWEVTVHRKNRRGEGQKWEKGGFLPGQNQAR